MRQTTHILKLLAVNCSLLAIGLLLLELAFGGWWGGRRLNRLNLPRDCVLQFDVSALYKDPNPVITYSRDEHGLRGAHGSPGNIDILTVGGSTTDQRFIRDGETWQDVLQAQLEQAGATVVIANAGVDGQSTYGHIKNFEWWFPDVPDLAPTYILYYLGLNDFHKDAGYAYDQLMRADRRGFDLKETIRENSALYHLYRTLYGAYRATVVEKIGHRFIDLNKVQWTRDALQKDYRFMESRLHAYAERLRLLADMTRDFGAKPIFVSQPSRQYRIGPDGLVGQDAVHVYDGYPYNGVDYYHMMGRLNSVTKAVAGEKNALFVDLANRSDWADSDFYDFSHMTPRGAEKVGTVLCDSLKSTILGAGQANASADQQ